MDHSYYLKELLRPLGVYDLSEGSYSESELYAAGHALDGSAAQLEKAEREMILATAEDEGLARWESLFTRRIADYGAAARRAAILSLLQVDNGGFTLAAINRAICGCGIAAVAEETGEYGRIRVFFPEVSGVPEGFAEIERIILDLIPCHLETEFYFRYLTWAECEAQSFTWAMLHGAEHTWESFSKAV